MSLFNVSVSQFHTATVEVEAEDVAEAIELAQEMVDNEEVDFESDGSTEFDVEEV